MSETNAGLIRGRRALVWSCSLIVSPVLFLLLFGAAGSSAAPKGGASSLGLLLQALSEEGVGRGCVPLGCGPARIGAPDVFAGDFAPGLLGHFPDREEGLLLRLVSLDAGRQAVQLGLRDHAVRLIGGVLDLAGRSEEVGSLEDV